MRLERLAWVLTLTKLLSDLMTAFAPSLPAFSSSLFLPSIKALVQLPGLRGLLLKGRAIATLIVRAPRAKVAGKPTIFANFPQKIAPAVTAANAKV